MEDTVDIFEIYLKKTRVNGNIKKFAQAAAEKAFEIERIKTNISGALIKNVVDKSCARAIKRGSMDGINLEDIYGSIVD